MITKLGRFTTKYGRYFFFGLLVIVCISFVFTVEMISCDDQLGRERVAGTLFGQDVTRVEFDDVKARWHGCRHFMAYSWKMQEVVGYAIDMKELKEAYFRAFFARNFIQGNPSEEELTSFTWRIIAFLREAGKEGIVATDAEVAEHVQDIFGGPKFEQERYITEVQQTTHLSVEAFEQTVREALLLSRYFGFVQDGAVITTEQVYNDYLEKTEKCRVRSVKFSATDFEDRVRLAPTRHAVRPVDESKRPVVVDGDSIFAWYLHEKGTLTVEPKVRLEYAFAGYDAFREGITPPTEPQMQERYELEKEKYRIKTADRVHKPFEEVAGDIRKGLLDQITDERVKQQYEADKETKHKKQDGTYAPFDEVKAQVRKDLEAAVTDEAVKEAYERKKAFYLITDDDKRYKSYDEVKEEIRKALEKDQMAEKAIEKLRALREEIDAIQIEDENAKIDLAALATNHGVTYGRTGLFDEKHMTQVEQAVGVSEDLKSLMTQIDGFALGTVFDRMDTDKGTFVARIDEKVDSFVPPLTVPLRRKLALSLVHAKAQRLAFRAARDLHREGRKRIDHAAEEWGKAHPDAKQEEREKALQGLRRDLFEGLVAEKGYSLVEGAPLRRNERDEAEMFDRPRYEIELLPTVKVPKIEDGDVEPSTFEENYWVAQLVDRYPPDGKDFDTLKKQLKDQLLRRRRMEFLDEYLKTVWENAKLEDRLHVRPVDENSPPPDDNP